jgi:hypothetical protein
MIALAPLAAADSYALPHDEAQAQGEPAEERGGAAKGTEVSGLQLYLESRTKTADRAESGAAIQGAGAGTDEPDAGCEHRTDGRRTSTLYAGLDRLLRAVSDAFRVGQPGGVGPAQAAVGDLEAVEAGKVRFAELRKRGVGKDLAAQTTGSAHSPWRLANSPALAIALPNAYFASLGLPRLTCRSVA